MGAGSMKTQEKIRFTTLKSKFGFVLVAFSEAGLCAVLMDDEVAVLVEDLGSRFPDAIVLEAGDEYKQQAFDVVESIENPGCGVEFVLDVRGTEFQKRVWEALVKIPIGETASYLSIAKAVQLPKAVRAVAGACAANKIAVLIPCHRVVKSTGALSGYRWGEARKRKLLELEAKQ